MTTLPAPDPRPAGDEGDGRPAGRGRLAGLWIAHGLGLAATAAACAAIPMPVSGWAVPFLPLNLLLAVVGAQACLLALWAAFSGGRWRRRFRLGGGGALLLGALTAAVTPAHDRLLLGPLPPATAAVVGLVALALRRRTGARLERASAWPPAGGPEGLRFSIRGLMALTLAVALLSALVRFLRDLAALGPSHNGLMLALIAAAIAAPAVGAAWAALGPGRSGGRSLVVLLLAPALAGLLAYGLRVDDRATIINLLTALAGPTPIVLASLFVARSAGYRLVGGGPGGVEPVGARHPLD